MRIRFVERLFGINLTKSDRAEQFSKVSVFFKLNLHTVFLFLITFGKQDTFGHRRHHMQMYIACSGTIPI